MVIIYFYNYVWLFFWDLGELLDMFWTHAGSKLSFRLSQCVSTRLLVLIITDDNCSVLVLVDTFFQLLFCVDEGRHCHLVCPIDVQ